MPTETPSMRQLIDAVQASSKQELREIGRLGRAVAAGGLALGALGAGMHSAGAQGLRQPDAVQMQQPSEPSEVELLHPADPAEVELRHPDDVAQAQAAEPAPVRLRTPVPVEKRIPR